MFCACKCYVLIPTGTSKTNWISLNGQYFCHSFQKVKPIYYIDALHIGRNISWNCYDYGLQMMKTVSGYVCNHGSPSGERDTASPRGHYGERLQRDSCLKKHMKKHHPLAGDSPWRHYRRDHNIRTAGRLHHPLLRLKLASEAWPQSLGDAVSRSPLGEPWLHT